MSDAKRTIEGDGGWSRGRIFGVVVGTALAAGIVILLVLGLVKSDQEFSIDRRIAENRAPLAPTFALPVLYATKEVGPEGATVSLAALRGHPVVVNLWASWCDPCKAEAPILEGLWRKYRSKGVIVLGVNTQDLVDDAKAFIAQNGVTFPSVRDGSDTTKQSFEVTGLPETFIVDPDGKMRILPVRGQLTESIARTIAEHLDTVVAR